MGWQIRIEHGDGTTERIPLVEYRVDQAFEKMDQASIWGHRADINSLSTALTERADEVYVEDPNDGDVFGGPLLDIRRGGPRPELVTDSMERYAKYGEPFPGNTRKTQDDSTWITDALSRVDELSAGTIQTDKTNLELAVSHAFPSEVMRTAETASGNELRFNPDKTVDFVGSLGGNKTGTTISPGTQRMVGDVTVERRAGEEKATHLRALGAGEGEAQVSTEVTANNYSSGDPKFWARRENTDLTTSSALTAWANTVISELNDSHVEASVGVKGATPSLGDEYHLKHPDENLDHNLRAVELTDTYRPKTGRQFEVVFSSRQKSRTDPTAEVEANAQRFASGFQGDGVWGPVCGGRDLVTSSDNYIFGFRVPAEVEHIHRADLQVRGFPYRSRVDSKTGVMPTTSPSTFTYDNQTTSESLNASNSSKVVDTYDFGSGETYWPTTIYVALQVDNDVTVDRLSATINITNDPNPGSGDPTVIFGERQPGSLLAPEEMHYWNGSFETRYDMAGKTAELQVDYDIGSDVTGLEWDWRIYGFDPVNLDVQAGMTEFGSTLPKNCDVIVNGTSQGTSFGDGSTEFTEVVDISSDITTGAWNTIEVTSDTLGELICTADLDLYRQMLGDG